MTTTARVDPSELGTIIVVNGASSSGKTSLIAALRPLLSVPYHHLQLDAFRAMEPAGHWEGWKVRDERVMALQLAALCRAMNAAILEYSRHGQGVIFDTELSNRDAMQYALADLPAVPTLFIGVLCDIDETERRELARGDRPAGLARRQHESVHAHKEYDFMIDTTTASAEHCAARVAAWLETRPQPHAWGEMRAMSTAVGEAS